MLSSFDGFNFFEEEGSDDSGLDASSAKDSAVRSGDFFIFFGYFFVGVGSELRDSVESVSAFTAVVRGARSVCSLLDVVDNDS